MGELTIRLDDARIIEALAEMANLHQQSIENEVHGLLAKAAEDHARRRELVRRADAIAAMTPRGVVQTPLVELIREMRAERDRALGD